MAPGHARLSPDPERGRKAARPDTTAPRAKRRRCAQKQPQKAICKWAHCPAKQCHACLQTTHEIDRDCAEGKEEYLVWTKTRVNAQKELLPSGDECYRCFDTRRRYFKKHSMQDMIAKRKSCRPLDDKFTELRLDRQSGEKKFQDQEEVDTEKFIDKVKESFHDRFEEGTFHEIWSFAGKRNLKYDNEADLIDHIESKLGMNVVEDEEGNLGVEILDHDPGQYRFRRGRGERRKMVKREKYGKEADPIAKERFEQGRAKLEANATAQNVGFLSLQGRQEAWAQGPVHSEDEADAQAQSCGSKASTSRALRGLLAGSDTQESGAAGYHPSSHSRASTPSAHGAGSVSTPPPPVASIARPCLSSQKQLADKSSARSNTGSVTADEEGPGRKKRRCAAEHVIDSATELFKSAQERWSWPAQWENKNRKRDFEGYCTRLTTSARKCAAVLADEAATSLSENIFNFVEKVEARQVLFDAVRHNFVKVAQRGLEKAELKLLQEAPPTLLGSIITAHMIAALDKCVGNAEIVKALVSVAAFKPNDPPTSFCLTMVECRELAEQSQRGLVLAFAERVFKASDANAVQETLLALARAMPVNVEELSVIDLNCKHPNSAGWFPQPLADVHCIVMIGKSLKLGDDDVQGPPTRDFRLACICAVEHYMKFSSRIKSQLKKSNGVGASHARFAWGRIKAIHDEYAASGAAEFCAQDIFATAVDQFSEALAAGHHRNIFGTVVDFTNEHAEQVQKFGKHHATLVMQGENVEDTQLVCSFKEKLTECIAVVLQKGLGPNCTTMIEKLFSDRLWDGPYDLLWTVSSEEEDSVESCSKQEMCDSQPQHLIMFEWLHAVCKMMQSFEGEGTFWFCMQERLGLTLRVYAAWQAHHVDKDVQRTVGHWAETWQGFKNIPSPKNTPDAEASPATKVIVDFFQKMASVQCLKTTITEYITALVATAAPSGAEGDTPLKEALVKEGLLPDSIPPILQLGLVMDRFQGLANDIEKAKQSPGLLQMSSLLGDIEKARGKHGPLLAKRTQLSHHIVVVRKAAAEALREVLRKCEVVPALRPFVDKHAPILNAIDAWSFDKLEWLYADSDDESNAAAKRIEQLASQHPIWQSILERAVPDIALWAEEELRAKAQQAASLLPENQELVNRAARLLATSMLTSVALRHKQGDGKTLNAALKYCDKMLKVQQPSLPKTLLTKIAELQAKTAPDQDKPSAKKKDPAAGSADTSSVASPPAKLRKI